MRNRTKHEHSWLTAISDAGSTPAASTKLYELNHPRLKGTRSRKSAARRSRRSPPQVFGQWRACQVECGEPHVATGDFRAQFEPQLVGNLQKHFDHRGIELRP
jgi:hypothetical protein